MTDEAVILRQWRDDDLAAFAAMNADAAVMRHFPALLTPEESAAMMRRLRDMIAGRGWGLWAVDVEGELAGFTGLSVPTFEAPFMPCVEIGWRFRREFWGRGLATAAARQAERFAWEQLKLRELVSFTAAANDRSRRLMERLGFRRDEAGDFDHPRIPAGHPVRRHVLYRKAAPGR